MSFTRELWLDSLVAPRGNFERLEFVIQRQQCKVILLSKINEILKRVLRWSFLQEIKQTDWKTRKKRQ